ncbi:1,2-dihydroxy-3-keto-5-methylthiopentene dioxygenase [Blyttiomyces sp. JEL0837]|nr:1,2-dihydroxy-3-keto-5-methylthiopentene dioxygenase [Blyttiomyces sp. JEL0837]
MVSAWKFNDNGEDQRELHQFTPNKEVTLDDLKKLGIYYFRFDITDPDYQSKVDGLAAERQYKNRDFVHIEKGVMPNYEEKIKSFFEEHIHEDEEIRFIVDGTGYFDVRDKEDHWIRIAVEASDLIIVPAGIYHRFTLDTKNYIKAMRLFKEDPKWTPINRSLETTDANKFRVDYVNWLSAH